MNKKFESMNNSRITFTTGLAIFAMLFGSGNLIFPLRLGILAGDKTYIGLVGFIISGVLIPLAGLLGVVLFDGNYRDFFYRIGKIPGALLIFFSMLIIGPIFTMPRIVALSYALMKPFMPLGLSSLPFNIIFLLVAFILCYQKNFLVDLMGKILSPLKLISLFTIIGIGFYKYVAPVAVNQSALSVFFDNFQEGYNTLDLFGTIFFGYIILSILRNTADKKIASDNKVLAKIILNGGIIAGVLLATVYIFMAYLGAFHGNGLEYLGVGQMFVETLRRIMGDSGAFLIGITIMVACLSTLVALASVVSEYLRTEIFDNKIEYNKLLVLVLIITAFMASAYDLDRLLKFFSPIMYISYPILIVLTFCNIAYKFFGFKYLKAPVLITFIIMSFLTIQKYIN